MTPREVMPPDFPDGVEGNTTLLHLGTARAVRRYTRDPVPAAMVDALVWAATRASSPNNSQLWHFVVVREESQKVALAERLHRFTKWIDSLPPPESTSDARVRAGARSLLVGLAEVPVLIFVCVEHSYPEREPDERYLWSTAGTAGQNLIVAARSLQLGACLTMLHVGNESGVRELLGLPEHVQLGAMVTVGWPAAPHGPMRRHELSTVIHRDRW